MNTLTQLHLTAGDMTHVVNNLTYYKAEALAEASTNEVAVYFDGENEFVMSNRTGLDYIRWELRHVLEDSDFLQVFYARDVDHARRIADTTLDHYQHGDDYYLLDEEGEEYTI